MNIRKTFTGITLAFFVALLFAACSKNELIDTIEENPILDDNEIDGYIEVSEDPADFESRYNAANEVIILKDGDFGRSEAENDLIWYYTAELEPLEYQGVILSATHIVFKDDRAYVSYHKQGDTHLGAIEVINLSDRQRPYVIAQAFFPTADVNSIYIDEEFINNKTRLWASVSDKNIGAALVQLRVKNNGTFRNKVAVVELSDFVQGGISASANAVVRTGDYLYVTSGKSYGGTFCLNVDDLSYVGHADYQNAKYVLGNYDQNSATKVISLETGNNAQIRVEDVGDYDFSNTYSVGSILHQFVAEPTKGKSVLHTVDAYRDIVFIASGASGLKAYNINSGNLFWSSPSEMIERGNTNGIASDDDYIYVANGADGLAVFKIPENPNDDPTWVFNWDLNEGLSSANFVQADGNWIFVAKGGGGLKILKKPEVGDLLPISTYNSNGKPDNLEENVEVCSELLPNIFSNALPEGQNAMTLHPEYFEESVVKNIHLQEDAELNVTFVHEGAGYTNVLGYYYYPADNPPASTEDIIKLIVFPNASASGSGGELIEGSTMKLLGTFDAGTVIEFFVISNGWRSGEVTNGEATQYTNPDFNSTGTVQSLIFHDQTCSSTVVCIEDITVPNGDNDFNDAIFQITANPASAIDYSAFLQL